MSIISKFFLGKLKSRDRFTELAQRDDQHLPLDETALVIGMEEYLDLSVPDYLKRLDVLAVRLKRRLLNETEPEKQIQILNNLLFVEEKFTPDIDNPNDPRNCFLSEVIDKRKGIPVTLSVLYLEVARRANLPIFGIGMPGYFLVKYENNGEEIIIDPFRQGKIMTEQDCITQLNELFKTEIKFEKVFLKVQTNRQILKRILSTLKTIYLHSSDLIRALSATERLLILVPDDLVELRDRGLIYFNLRMWNKAYNDLTRYISLITEKEEKQVYELIAYLKMHLKN